MSALCALSIESSLRGQPTVPFRLASPLEVDDFGLATLTGIFLGCSPQIQAVESAVSLIDPLHGKPQHIHGPGHVARSNHPQILRILRVEIISSVVRFAPL